MDSSNKRISLDALAGGGKPGGTTPPGKAPPPRSTMVKNADALEAAPSAAVESETKAVKLKVGIACVCLAVAGVLLLHNFGIIELWGGDPPPVVPTEEEVQAQQEGIKYQQEQERAIEAMPENRRPVRAGS